MSMPKRFFNTLLTVFPAYIIMQTFKPMYYVVSLQIRKHILLISTCLKKPYFQLYIKG